jgi:hypothetical protein
MGLTLNTNSLTVASSGGSAASGVSTSDVTTLIKNNTPYQFITKVAIPTSSVASVSCSNVFSASDGFSMYHVVFDQVTTAANEQYYQIRLEKGGSFVTSGYGWSMARGYGNVSFTYESTDSRWRIYNSDSGHGFFGFLDITNTANSAKTLGSWRIGSGSSNSDGGFCIGGGSIDNTNECTGFQFRTASNDFTGGTIRIYGVNNV